MNKIENQLCLDAVTGTCYSGRGVCRCIVYCMGVVCTQSILYVCRIPAIVNDSCARYASLRQMREKLSKLFQEIQIFTHVKTQNA